MAAKNSHNVGQETRPLNLILGFRLKTGVVIAGQQCMIGSNDSNIVYGVSGEEKHVKQILEFITTVIRKKQNKGTIKSFADDVYSYIDKTMKLDRSQSVSVLIGGYDIDNPDKACLYRVNKADILWVGQVIAAGRCKEYADMIVLDEKKYNRMKSVDEMDEVWKEAFEFSKKYGQSPSLILDISSARSVSSTLPCSKTNK